MSLQTSKYSSRPTAQNMIKDIVRPYVNKVKHTKTNDNKQTHVRFPLERIKTERFDLFEQTSTSNPPKKLQG